MKLHKKRYIILLLLVMLAVSSYLILKPIQASDDDFAISTEADLKEFTAEDLRLNDGTNPELPIYLGFDGKVYDVTAGKEFYKKGGVYHFLAGKDSTTDLNIAGGEIIKRKYPVIGKLIN